MAIQIFGITIEKTTLDDTDLFAIDDPLDGNKSKKVRASNIFTYFIGKVGATAVEIARVCSGNTATASEITQICDGRTAGGTGVNDLVTIGDTQLIINKEFTLPKFNGSATEVTLVGQQLNTLTNTTGSGRVNEVQQGLAVGNTTITASGSYAYHGLVNINLSSTDSIVLGPLSSYNVSEIVALKNISATTSVTVNRAGSDRFYQGGTGYVSFILTPGQSVALMAMGSNRWLVLGYSTVTFS